MNGERRKLLITRALSDRVLAYARENFETTVWSKDQPIGAGFDAAACGQDAVLIMPTEALDAARLTQLRKDGVRAVATFSVGYDHIDVVAASRLGLPVFHTPDVLSDAVADLAMFLILAATRGTTESERILRAGEWGPWSPTAMLGRQLGGLRLGVYGMGRIGQALARRARAFDLAIHYHNRSRLAPSLEQGAHFHAEIDTLMQVSDVLCICAPATAQTRASINAHRLSLLPSGAAVVNVARGDLIDEEALIAALKEGRIGSVGLDVFQNEPHVDRRFLGFANATLLPHIGSATQDAREQMGLLALNGLTTYLVHGKLASNCVNP
ncbi:MAG: D-glycerate dehydrogenase [Comamonadaceae bacterium]|nr:MAG: D-glycerate dehydrogenase [Comamonadaceae bacterium]